MKATEFVYWLQGHFEIEGADKALSQAQALRVLEKASAVKAGPGALEQESQSFVTFTQGVLFPVSQGLGTPEYLGSATTKLGEKLHDLFVHAIDPSYGSDQAGLQSVHDGSAVKPAVPPRDQPGRPQRMC